MAIIRSKIARQLLAEGGAPRKGYVTGGDIEDDVAQMEMDMGISGGPSPSEYSGMDNEEQQAIDQARFDAGFRTPDYISMGVSDDATDRGFFRRGIDALGAGLQRGRGNLIFNYLGKAIAPTMRGRLGLGKPGDINYVLDVLNNPDDRVYGLSNKEREIGEKLIDAGITDEFDIRNMTQSQFDNLFPGPQTGEGGDSEPIKKLRAPITEAKKEEPKNEFDELLKFYGARFARGGSTGFEGSPEMGGRGTEETYGFDQSGPAGDSGDDSGPPTVMGGGTEPPMLSGGRAIDIAALERQGLTPAEIATVFNDYYGLDTTPTVAGPLGSGLGALTPQAPAMGQQVPGGLLGAGRGTTGTKGTQPTGFDVKDVQPTSGYGGAKDVATGKALADFLKEAGPDFLEATDAMKKSLEPYGGPRFEDGGEVREEYFGGGLTDVVKKGIGAVKKIVKSPIGKAAILGFGLKFAKPDLFANVFAKDSFIMKNKALSGILAASLAAGALSKEEEEDDTLPAAQRSDPAFQSLLAYYGGPRRFAAEGGMMEQDEMLDLGGKEMDLRGGGFVPLGEYEKKDDVPARLSKNEFVFTADAVRAAGGGSVDKGADVMYKTMKTLENKVA